MSNEHKLAVFTALFCGRDDVYATRWESRRTGRSGYTPECRNRFVEGVCDLKNIPCGACPNRAFRPLDRQAVVDHLRGRHVLGLYPLLPDATCWLLAMDFDEGAWREEVTAVRTTCARMRLPVYVERSRSGKGAHLWFFFTEPVRARDARALGARVLSETVGSDRGAKKLRAYDRLFPSQDSMPAGGFGNLIALPLQGQSRREGNSLFVDDAFEPYDHEAQWRLLAGAERITPGTLTEAVSAAREALDNSFRLSTPPARSRRKGVAPLAEAPSGPLPATLHVTLTNRALIVRDDLPSGWTTRLKEIASFHNPEFYRRQIMRQSTSRTPRIICCAESTSDHLALPRGCLEALRNLAAAHAVPISIDDQRAVGLPLDVRFVGALSPQQTAALAALTVHETGVLVAPPGAGKTVIATAIIAQRAVTTLVLVPRLALLEQWRDQLAKFLGIPTSTIGCVGGGRREPNGRLDVAMIPSLAQTPLSEQQIRDYGLVIVDECHHGAAVGFERVLASLPARYVYGLTATPRRRDGLQPITEMQLGPVRFEITAKDVASQHAFAHELVIRETVFEMPDAANPTITEMYAALASDDRRNDQILDDIIATIHEGRSPIVLSERREHVAWFAERLVAFSRNVFVMTGGMSAPERRVVEERLRALGADEQRVVIATGQFIGEGFDDARLDTLFLALPVSWKGLVVQYAGRLHRAHPGKRAVRVFDYVDVKLPVMRRMYEKRLRQYRAIGYESTELPDGFEMLADLSSVFEDTATDDW